MDKESRQGAVAAGESEDGPPSSGPSTPRAADDGADPAPLSVLGAILSGDDPAAEAGEGRRGSRPSSPDRPLFRPEPSNGILGSAPHLQPLPSAPAATAPLQAPVQAGIVLQPFDRSSRDPLGPLSGGLLAGWPGASGPLRPPYPQPLVVPSAAPVIRVGPGPMSAALPPPLQPLAGMVPQGLTPRSAMHLQSTPGLSINPFPQQLIAPRQPSLPLPGPPQQPQPLGPPGMVGRRDAAWDSSWETLWGDRRPQPASMPPPHLQLHPQAPPQPQPQYPSQLPSARPALPASMPTATQGYPQQPA
eukprot:EG_transcript_18033